MRMMMKGWMVAFVNIGAEHVIRVVMVGMRKTFIQILQSIHRVNQDDHMMHGKCGLPEMDHARKQSPPQAQSTGDRKRDS